ncbi:MAG: hypothetical protein RI988_4075 [Pseudomonadota bacterium]
MTSPHAPRWLSALLLLAGSSSWAQAGAELPAGPAPLPVTSLVVEAASQAVPPLVCPAPPRQRPGARAQVPARPGRAQAARGPDEPTDLPDDAEVARALAEPANPDRPPAPAARVTVRPAPQSPLRVAVWGDSHMAAGFFTEELARLAGVRDTLAQPRLLPAGFGHAGVRGLVRRACVSGRWVRESAHASATAARQPGPGLVSLVNAAPAAELAWDLRDADGQARHRRVRLLVAPSAAGVALEVSADGASARTVLLGSEAAGSVLELTSAGGALSVLRLRVLEGTLRLQGLQLGEPEQASDPLQIDLYGYPGATVAGWAQADAAAHAAWFTDRRYDLVVLAYGTNEANDPAFRAEDYRAQLVRAVTRLRERFPDSQCLLVAPGDRGVRVPRKRAAARPRTDVLRYARLHAQVAAIQQEVAQAAGCAAWSMQAAMGGAGSAYRWARQQPAWMAPDLIHFTPAGYRELARRLGAELGWVAP